MSPVEGGAGMIVWLRFFGIVVIVIEASERVFEVDAAVDDDNDAAAGAAFNGLCFFMTAVVSCAAANRIFSSRVKVFGVVDEEIDLEGDFDGELTFEDEAGSGVEK